MLQSVAAPSIMSTTVTTSASDNAEHQAGVSGLPLAAKHAKNVAHAMSSPSVGGDWSVTIVSGNADQQIWFKQIEADEAQPDAELLELGREFDRLYLGWLPLLDEWRRLQELSDKAWRAKGEPFDLKLYHAHETENGCAAAGKANSDALDQLSSVTNAIRSTPASTIEGLYVKARVIKFESFSPWQFTADPNDMDWDISCFAGFLAEIEQLAKKAVAS